MARQVRSARGDLVDFDQIQIKQALADAPMNIEVERRKAFIDQQEKPSTRKRSTISAPEIVGAVKSASELPTKRVVIQEVDFENDNPGTDIKGTVEAVPIIPTRSKK